MSDFGVLDSDAGALACGIRDDAADLSEGRSPYERRACPECGGTHVVTVADGDEGGGAHVEDCSICGPPSRPDPGVWVKGEEDAAANLWNLARETTPGRARDLIEEDAQRHELRAKRLAGLPEVK